MAKTYVQLAKEIESLTKAAAALRKREMPAVVAKIKEAIEAYGLTADDLGLGSGETKTSVTPSKAPAAPAKSARKAAPATSGAKVPVKYRDDNGNSWTGRGSKPGWLQAALAAGQSLESFAIDSGTPSATGDAAEPAAKSTTRAKSKAKPKAKAGKGGGTVKYKDDAGHTWSGFGPQPGWLKAALADGKTIDDLRA